MEDKKYKILTGKADEQECLNYYKYLETKPDERDDFIQFKNLLAIQNAATQKRSIAEKEKQVTALWKKIENKPEPISWRRIFAYAALLMVMLSITQMIYFWNKQMKASEEQQIVSITSCARSINQFSLADGSSIWLNANSTINILSDKADKVELALNGEAYFDIIHNENRLFIVNAGGLKIIDKGTKFSVQSHEGDHVTASLIEGRIDILTKQNDIHSLIPGQQFIQHNNTVSIQAIPKSESQNAWMSGKFMFRNTPLSQIMSEVEQWYGVNVFFENEHTKMFQFTGTVDKNISLDKIMQMLSYSMSFKYKIIETTEERTNVIIE